MNMKWPLRSSSPNGMIISAPACSGVLLFISAMILFSCDESVNTPSKIQDLHGDFNGDQFPDRASALGDRMTVDLNNKSGGFDSFVWIVSNEWGSPGWTVVGDFDETEMMISHHQAAPNYI